LLDASTRAVRAYGIGAEPQQPVAAPPAGVQLAGRAPAPPLHASSARESAGELGPAGSALAEAVVWHGLASLLVPGVAVNRCRWGLRCYCAQPPWQAPPQHAGCLTSHRTVWAATRLVTRLPRLPALAARALPAAAGLLAIPLLVPHIDAGVDTWMDRSVRPALAPSEWKQAE
jgi:hypothetical protein